jgi:tricorn protease
MRLRLHPTILAAVCTIALCWSTVQAATLKRFPSSSATEIAFVAHGDLWRAPRDGGKAVRVVKSDGELVAARFSPDGRWIAYTQRSPAGQDVFVVAANGGKPTRLTFDTRPQLNLVVAWSADSRQVVFLSDRQSVALSQIQAFSVAVSGGQARRLPLGQAGTLSYSPDGASIAYTRTFTTLKNRKRYVGGQAEDLFLYNFASHQGSQITDWKGTDTAPMWSGRHVYFLSDRGAGWRMNLWRYDLDDKAFTQITHFSDFDIDSPALGANRITFQQGGRLWALDLPDERLHALQIEVADDGARTAPRELDVTPFIVADDYAYASGAVLFSARGDIFRVALADGRADNLTATPAINEASPATSPDGSLLAYVTEDDKAQQIALRPLAGGQPRQLTHFDSGVLYQPRFSPDGQYLAVTSAEHELWLVPLDGRAPQRAGFDPNDEIHDAAFSPDGRWLAFSTLRSNGLSALHLYEIGSGRDRILSAAFDGDRLPAFSADGATLYFVSRRHERVLTPDRGDEATLAAISSDGLYALSTAAARDSAAPMDSAYALPVPGGRITALEVLGTQLFYATRPVELLSGDDPTGRSQLHAFDAATKRDRIVLQDFDNHVLAADGRSVLFRRDDAWLLQDADAGATRPARTVAIGPLLARVEPRAEWRQMFEQAWRLDRDLFFSRVMNGSNWQAVHDAYANLLPLIGSGVDMQYLLQQLQGEMATSHAYISRPRDAAQHGAVPTRMLGADFALDARSGRYYLARTYLGDPTRPRFRSPLNMPESGQRIVAGTYVLAIDGVDLRAPTDPDSLLAGKTDELTLTIADRPDGTARQVKVQPVANDMQLRLHAWIEANRARVAQRSGNRVGYLFVSNFSARGAEDLMQQWQGQLDKEGLIIDVRWNGGGFTSQAVLGLLRRERAGVLVNRDGALAPLPLFVAPRAMATIINEGSASDGDQFPYYFRAFGLGAVIGQRTWGGVQGIKKDWRLMDGTGITVPKDSLASTDGHWLIENAGVAPDIAIAPQADDVLDGVDRSLDAAIDNVLHKIAQSPPEKLSAPPALPAYPAAGDVRPTDFKLAPPSR